MDQDAQTNVFIEQQYPQENFSFLPVNVFWRRVAAFAIDGLILGLPLTVLGFALKGFLFQIGPHGRFIGIALILVYFGVLGSSVNRGQTGGKRILGIPPSLYFSKPF